MSKVGQFDVIIAGGGMAGVAVAAALGEFGYRVALVEPGMDATRRLAGELIHPRSSSARSIRVAARISGQRGLTRHRLLRIFQWSGACRLRPPALQIAAGQGALCICHGA